MKIILASNNKHKIEEVKKILPDFDIVSLEEAEIDIDIEENSATFADNAKIKAEAISAITGEVVMADDSGLCVEALGGAPGVYSARFSGEGDDANNALLLEKMQGEENRRAHFECAIYISVPNGEDILEVGKWYGTIDEKMRGKNGFGYDVLFIPDEYPDKTSAELTPAQKNSISHRGIALAKIKERLIKL